METFEDVYKTICRVCLKPGNRDNMVSLLNKASKDGLSCYGKAAQVFADIYIANDFLPSSMCKQCLNLLTQALVFKNTCDKSQIVIEKLLSEPDIPEHEFRKNLVEFVLFSSILSDNNSNTTPLNKSVLSKQRRLTKKAEYGNETMDLFCSEERSKHEADLPLTSENPGNLSLENEEENDLFADSFQDYLDLDSDDSSDDKKPSLDSTTSAIPNEVEPSNTTNSNMECVEDEKDDKKGFLEVPVFDPVVSKDSADELLDTIEEIIHMDRKILRKITGAVKKEKTSYNRKVKREYWKKTEDHICQYCNKIYSSKSSLKLHIERHTGLLGFTCEFCAKRFATKGELQYHLAASHDEGNKFVCDECGYQALTKYQLKEHVRVHTGETPFTCDKCPLKFRQKFVWKRHLLCHSEKTVQCKECIKKFRTTHEMKVHMNNVHDRRYVYACDYCDVKYAKIGTVRRHLQEQHGISRPNQGKVKKISLDNEKAPKKKYRKRWVPPTEMISCD